MLGLVHCNSLKQPLPQLLCLVVLTNYERLSPTQVLVVYCLSLQFVVLLNLLY